MHASSRQTEEAEAGDGGTEPHKSNPLTQRVTCMETNGRIPSCERQRFPFSALQMSQAPSFSLHRQDMASPVRHLLTPKQMLLQELQLPSHWAFHRHMWEVMNEWLQANDELKQLTSG